MTELNTNLDIIPSGVAKTIRVSQYDHKSRNIIIRLLNNKSDFTIPSGSTVQIRGTKPSGKGFSYNCSFSGSKVTVEIMDQMTAEAGKIPCEIVLLNGDKILGSEVFNLLVEKTTLDPETITSSDTFDSLVEGAVVKCVNENLIELYVDTELNIESEAPVANKVVTSEFKNTRNRVANAIKGELYGSIILARDVSPVEHNPIIKAHSYNIFNPNIMDTSYNANGLTITRNGDEITINGTSTKSFSCPVIPLLWKIKKGKDYTCTVYRVSGTGDNFVASFGEGNIASVRLGFYDCTSISGKTSDYRTFTASYDYITSFMLFFNSGVTFNNLVIKIQLAQDSLSKDYSNYLDPTTIQLKRYGKNLLPKLKSGHKETINGGTFIVLADGGIDTTGTPTDNSYIKLYDDKPIIKYGKMAISLQGNTKNILVQIILRDSNGTQLGSANIYAQHIINMDDFPTASKMELYFKRIDSNVAISGVGFVQVEVDQCTDYEIYKEHISFTPNSEGYVDDILSLSPSMTILSDVKGVVIECEYIRDSNKVIKKLTNAIIALGGSV